MYKLTCISNKIRFTLFFHAIFIVTFISGYSQNSIIEVWKSDIKDTSQYDHSFLKYWEYVKPNRLKIVHDSIIINNETNNPIIIPTEYPVGKEFRYSAFLHDTTYYLVVKRINYTNFQYSLDILFTGKLILSQVGIAVLEPSFYLGAEGAFQDNKGHFYRMNEYIIAKKNKLEIKLTIPEGTKDPIYYQDQISNRKINFNLSKRRK